MPVQDAVRAGDLRHIIHILEPVTKDSSGKQLTNIAGAVVQYRIKYPYVQAAIEPAKATDAIRTGQTATLLYTQVTIRYIPDVRPTMRVQWIEGNNIIKGNYIIQGILDEQERHRKLTLVCLALGNQV